MFKTRITEMLGIECPILLGPMLWISRAELVAAVSNAGGLGILVGLCSPTPEELREEIKRIRGMTDKPFAVNITLLPTARPIDYEAYFGAAVAEGVSIVETSGRSPEPYIKMLKDAGAKEVHMFLSSPEIKYSCFYGINTPTRKELISANNSNEKIAKMIGGDQPSEINLSSAKELLAH